jgi:hypothetical protein
MAGETTALKRDADMSPASKKEAEVAAAKPPKIPKEIVIDLEVPVMAHGEKIDKLVFRMPTGGDLMTLGATGWPVQFNYLGHALPNAPVMGEMMSALAAVPLSTIKALTMRDFATCAFALMVFFAPRDQWMQY